MELNLSSLHNLKNTNPRILAYVGDCVFELFVRVNSVKKEYLDLRKLNDIKQKVVCCISQAAFIDEIKGMLTDEEQKIFKWGRNARQKYKPSNSKKIQYCKATGLETLLGYLYLEGKLKRIKEILSQLKI